MIIVLMGYMGSGKSTIGQMLSEVLNYKFIDLDAYIELKESMPIKDVFSKKGEIYFRKKEMQNLTELLSSNDNIVLALGGGTPCYGNNLNLILNTENVKSYYLQTSLTDLSNRLRPEKSKRPLISHLKSEEEFIEFLGKHLFERASFYSQANFTINTSKNTKQDIVEAITKILI